MDCIPIVSQVKSIVQCSIGDWEGARETQENFSKQCIVASQIRSTVEQIKGDEQAAQQTNEEFYRTTDGFFKKTPIIGHARGCVAYLSGDKCTGDETMVQATKTTVGMAMVAFFLHGGFLIGGGCFVVAQKVKEDEIAEPPRTPSREVVKAPRLGRTRTTNVALNKLEMLDKTLDAFSPAFFTGLPTMLGLHTSEARATSHVELEDSEPDSEVKVHQHTVEVEEEEEEKGPEKKNRRRQTKQLREERRRARSSSIECRRRLTQWRQDMVNPRV